MAQDCPGCKECKLIEEEVNELEDVISGLKLLGIHKLDQTGVASIDDVRQRLRKHLASIRIESVASGESDEQNVKINSDTIKDSIVAQRDGCQKLFSVAQKIKDLVTNLPQGTIRKDLYTAIPDTDERLKSAEESLEKDELMVLVAGDTGSGKSSLLNLLLADSDTNSNILPVAHISSTSAICEIRYKEAPALKVKESGPKEFINIPIRDKQHALEEISKYAHQRGQRNIKNKYDIVKIYWPVEWLKNNIVIVDSPGVAESKELTDLVKTYIPKASGFIYVINPTIDGGFAPEKLKDLLFAHLKKEKRHKEEQAFDHRSAIFVCNKWDEIKKDEKKGMIEHIKNNLYNIWPGFGQDQLFFFSATQAAASLKDNYTPKDYEKLLLGLEQFLPIACHNRLTKQYWSLREVINRTNLTLRLDLVRQNTDEKHDNKYYKIMDDLDRIQHDQDKITKDLHEMAKQEVQTCLDHLKQYLATKWDELLKWEERDFPEVPRRKEDLDYVLEHTANIRVQKYIEEWAWKYDIFGEIEKKINERFNSKFCELRAELDFIVNYTLVPGNFKVNFTAGYVNFNFVYGHLGSQKEQQTFMGGVREIVNLIFALGVPTFKTKESLKDKTAELKAKAYTDNKQAIMKDVTSSLLAKLQENAELKNLFKDCISELHASIDNLLLGLPNIIQANRKLVENVLKRLSTETRELCEVKHNAGFGLENEINTVYLSHIKKYDIELNDLEPSTWQNVGKGHYSVVYAAKYKGENVAVKKPNGLACGHISTNFVLEETNFRNLAMANIVKLVGTAVQKEQNGVYPLLVLEYCKCSLDKIVLDHKTYTAPGKVSDQNERENGSVYKNTSRYGMDVSSALKSLHALGYVHRDLKLENILVDSQGRVKLADLALCKQTEDITPSHAGTLVYMAPEVQHGKMYNHSADIFSLGMVIWQLWYGVCVAEKYHLSNLDEFKENCFTDYAPPKPWIELIQSCLKREPSARPTADDVFQFFCVASKPVNEDVETTHL